MVRVQSLFWMLLLLLALPARVAGHGHGHSHHHSGCAPSCADCDPGCGSSQQAPAGRSSFRLGGTVLELVYLPAADPEAAMVELKLSATGEPVVVRLAPSGFLHRGGIAVKEGDSIELEGFWAGAAGNRVFVATSISASGRALRLRDSRGRSLW